ncbi:TonB family protein [Herbaspirillum huttiense]|uniref:TonB family protein n=2 Tax=Herbaspirillum huttiense TaxID=863372 RepID=A0AAJ2LTE5_9BURK|nr:TonB family protein [Herbaspirillum huttiense]MDR9838832.1 TonB family protein [Herbaspirillum huttiense]
MAMQLIYRHRDWVAALPATGLILLLVTAGIQVVKPLKPKYDEPVKLEVIDPVSLPPPPQLPQPPKTPPSEPAPRSLPPPRPTPPVPKPELPKPTTTPAVSVPAPVAAPTPPAPAAPAPAAVAPPTPPAPPAPKPNVEAEFIARVRAYLNAVKRYPTGREASLQRPEGTVKVWFILNRDGSVVDAGIEQSSNSMLLDQAARRSMGMGRFPAFPEQFQPGQSTHRFVVDLEFKPATD